LRERPDDIVLLGRYFIERFCRDLNKKPIALSSSAEQEMRNYAWPGNVRELQNCIERAVILTEGDTIHARHLSLSFRGAPAVEEKSDAKTNPWAAIDLSGTLAGATARVMAEVERRKLEQALSDSSGNRMRAAKALQISYKTFMEKLKEYGMDGAWNPALLPFLPAILGSEPHPLERRAQFLFCDV